MASPSQAQLQSLSDEYQKLQGVLQDNISARQKLEAQQQENENVQKEFDSLGEDANIYKLVGPVLLKQERSEAKMAVDGRLEFITKEIERIEEKIKQVTEQSEAKKTEIIQIQSQAQGGQQEAAAA